MSKYASIFITRIRLLIRSTGQNLTSDAGLEVKWGDKMADLLDSMDVSPVIKEKVT